MIKYYLGFSILIIFCFYRNTTHNVSSKADYLKIDGLNNLAWEYRKKDEKIALEYAREALKLSNRYNYNEGKATAYKQIGLITSYGLNPREALLYYDSAIIALSGTNDTLLAKIYNNKAVLYKNLSDYDNAKKYFTNSLAIKTELNDSLGIAKTYNNISNVYFYEGKYSLSIEYLIKSIEIKERLNDKSLGVSYMNLSNRFEFRHNYQNALHYNHLAFNNFLYQEDSSMMLDALYNKGIILLDSGLYESAIKTFHNCLDVFSISDVFLSDFYDNLGNAYLHVNDFDKSLEYHNKSLSLREKSKIESKVLSSYINVGKDYYLSGNFDEALKYFYNALNINPNDPNELKRIYQNLTLTYEGLGKDGLALNYYKRYTSLKDSLFTIQKHLGEAELIEKYESDKKAQRIEHLQMEKSFVEAQASIVAFQRNASFFFSLMVIAVAFSAVKYYQFKKRASQELALKIEEINERRISDLMKAQELEVLNALLKGQETERMRVAQDLHDRIGCLLSTVKYHFSSFDNKLNEMADTFKEQYDKANTILDEACNEVRNVSHNLASGVLYKFGLVPALESLADNIRSSNSLQIEIFEFGVKRRLESTLELTLYRIVQELLANILKHAKAREVSIQITKRATALSLIVEDDGVGFDPQLAANGIGLKNIEARLVEHKGKLSIDSGLGSGTSIIIEIPLNLET
ncbi:tetratricopeptide repeat-containing sensor histidine kinase [Chondrinema litorale]|uniref:tetratricopeptide repeat-containing sensor histidine kinase n=1 Tax=Chondrinema litorale TaxID=2994555 RepID=UPI002542A4E9|nr:sensor histidine kinase [Chondrinema litorale]UZR96495.1 sensor histidine kinase [Chondrinema litorale]